jgi:hypothetical protein
MGSGGVAPPILTTALDGVEWLASRPGRFPLAEETLDPSDRRLGGSQSWTGRRGIEKSLL